MVELFQTAAATAATTLKNDGYLLHSEKVLTELASYAIERAQILGASASRTVVQENAGITVRARDGDTEAITRDGFTTLDMVVYRAGRSGRATSQALDLYSIDRAIAQALAIAEALEPDDSLGLPDSDQLISVPEVPMFAPAKLSVAGLVDAALRCEAAACNFPSGGDGLRVNQSGAASRDVRWTVATSQGICATTSASLQQVWLDAIAERDGGMAREMWSAVDRRLDCIDSPETVGAAAARRALSKLGARGLPTRRARVLIDATVANSVIAEFAASLMGLAQFHKTTFLPDALGRAALPSHIDLAENPFEPYGLASARCDSEGVVAGQRRIVDGGTIKGLFLGSAAARKLTMRSTGNADGYTNLTLSSRMTQEDDDLHAMWRQLGTGLWLTELLGGGLDPVTGSFSKAAAGYWIENGAPAGAVRNFTVAGSFPEMLRHIVSVGADVHRTGAIRSGSLLIESLQVAGAA